MILRLLLGDQLNIQHSWFNKVNNDVLYVLMEIRQETDYVQHHVHKVVAFFMAMRTFAKELRSLGHNVQYIYLDDIHNSQSLVQNITRLIEEHSITSFEYQSPDEYRLDKQLQEFTTTLPIQTKEYDTEHFLSARNDVETIFAGKKTYLMETFYRIMRKRYNILLQPDKQPIGGEWNFDADNRKSLPKNILPPPTFAVEHDASEIISLLQKYHVKTIGQLPDNLCRYPISREEALQQLEYFVEYLLPLFGTYQDAMTVRHDTLYHSCLSFALNIKLLSPMEVVRAVEQAYNEHPERISVAQAEGFIRQIIGWREYMRGVYWAQMPEYKLRNYFAYNSPLPTWFWTGETTMACAKHVIKQSLQTSYSHHIQRLMITGNIALLAGIHPDEVDAWYLGIYVDAVEWVQLPNTRGMSQYADGGLVASKPYVASANYVNKMSDFCSRCRYNPQKRTGEDACPLNSLYWNFFQVNADKLQSNNRLGIVYKNLEKMPNSEKNDIIKNAEQLLGKINQW